MKDLPECMQDFITFHNLSVATRKAMYKDGTAPPCPYATWLTPGKSTTVKITTIFPKRMQAGCTTRFSDGTDYELTLKFSDLTDFREHP